MRTFLLALLLAGAASPALAANPDPDERATTRAERAAASAEARAERQAEARQSRPEPRQRNVELRRGGGEPGRGSDFSGSELARPARTRPAAVDVRPSRGVEQQAETPGERAQRRVAREAARGGFAADGVETRRFETPGERAQRRVAGDTVRDWRARERVLERPDSPALVQERNLRRRTLVDDSATTAVQPREVRPTIVEGPSVGRTGDLVQPTRPLPRTFETGRRRVSPTPELGTEPPPPATASTTIARPQHRWRHDWRRDGRYDWRDWRRRHRSLFHFGFYYDPFGWDYFRYGIGWRLWPHYYRSSFWLSDPWMYRLPRAWGPYRWIRYHNDALLVNLYTGEVEDVVYDFFW